MNLQLLQLQFAILSTELLRLDAIEMFEQKIKKNKSRIKLKILQVYSSIWAVFKYSSLNNSYSTDTHSSVVAARKADQKYSGSNLLSFLLYFFISNWKDLCSNPVYSKFVNSVCTNKKLSFLSSLLQYNYLTRNQSFIFLCKNFLLQK